MNYSNYLYFYEFIILILIKSKSNKLRIHNFSLGRCKQTHSTPFDRIFPNSEIVYKSNNKLSPMISPILRE